MAAGSLRSSDTSTPDVRSRVRLEYTERFALDQWLEGHPELAALYKAKEALHALYRTRGYDRASQALTSLTDQLAASRPA